MDIKQKLLDGVNVVEVSQLIAAPLCGLTLADLGASVTKVESPHGDYTRTWAKPGAESAIFHMLNRGKRSVVLDPRLPGHRVHAREMVMQADVVIENLGDAMAHTYGVDYADISDVRPKLIWCSISGLGRGRGGRAIDMTLQASMGMSALTGEHGRPPLRGAMPFVDIATGMYAAQSVLAAILELERGGDGTFLDCAMIDAAATLTAAPAALALSGYSMPRRMGSESDLFVPSRVFETADGEYVHVVAISPSHWRAICRAIGHDDWLTDQRFATNQARLEHRDFIHSAIAEAIRGRTASDWCELIPKEGGFCARVREIEEAWADPLVRGRGRLVDIPGLEFPVPVPSLVHTELAAVRGPLLGEHNAALVEPAAEVPSGVYD